MQTAKAKKGAILITDGAGYMGSHVNLMLARTGWDAVVGQARRWMRNDPNPRGCRFGNGR